MSVDLAIGPINQCGQAFFWAEAVTKHLGHPAMSFSPGGLVARRVPGANLQDRAHASVPHPRLSLAAYRAYRVRRVTNGAPILVESFADVGGAQIEGVVFHGSEIRDPDRHMDRLGYSYYRLAGHDWVDRLRSLSRTNREKASGLPAFVSTPDLLLDLPAATWLPLTIDVHSWADGIEVFKRAKPVVLHLPSRRVPPIKGSEHIVPVLRRLASEGRITFLEPDTVPHAKVRDLVLSADIVVDQIMTGSYGVAAVEAMAAGRLVVGNIAPDVRALMSDPVPIADATPSNFADVMTQILDEPRRFAKMAAEGTQFVMRWHAGRAAAKALRPFVEAL